MMLLLKFTHPAFYIDIIQFYKRLQKNTKKKKRKQYYL